MKFSELCNMMRDFNKKHNIRRKVDYKHKEDCELIRMVAKVVITNKPTFKREFTAIERTYTFNNYQKALCPDDLGYSIFAYCEYDDDIIRMEHYPDCDVESAEIIEVVE